MEKCQEILQGIGVRGGADPRRMGFLAFRRLICLFQRKAGAGDIFFANSGLIFLGHVTIITHLQGFFRIDDRSLVCIGSSDTLKHQTSA